MLELLTKPFSLGLYLGLLFFFLSVWSHLKTKLEFRRYKKMLSDKLELDARGGEVMRKEKELLAKENEHLRIRVQQLSEKPDQKIIRDLEILTRAEKRMMVQAPGFAPAWEAAKAHAADELAEEDSGKSLPRRLFNRLFGGGASVKEMEARLLPDAAPPATSTANNGAATEAAEAPAAPEATKN